MPDTTREVSPTKDPRRVIASDGTHLRVPDDWDLLPPGDAGLTRKLKSLGPTWTVKVRRRRRLESRGVWASAENIAEARRLVADRRAEPAYARKQASAAKSRERKQTAYVDTFEREVMNFLAFHPRHADVEAALARAVAAHATPVGSGTVARTSRIPVSQRAEAAVIAWLRHQTTAYDHMKIARVKGRRREVRRMLADASRQLLEGYRLGDDPSPACPLGRALKERADDVRSSPD